jgi:hypothetical protein|nr:MAG TPA: hypothetical protein [Caudoviricetes sp.]
MKTLFDEDVNYNRKVYKRDRQGRFASEEQARYEKAYSEACYYKQMYFASLSRMKGLANIIRQKDELILKLKSK